MSMHEDDNLVGSQQQQQLDDVMLDAHRQQLVQEAAEVDMTLMMFQPQTPPCFPLRNACTFGAVLAPQREMRMCRPKMESKNANPTDKAG